MMVNINNNSLDLCELITGCHGDSPKHLPIPQIPEKAAVAYPSSVARLNEQRPVDVGSKNWLLASENVNHS